MPSPLLALLALLALLVEPAPVRVALLLWLALVQKAAPTLTRCPRGT